MWRIAEGPACRSCGSTQLSDLGACAPFGHVDGLGHDVSAIPPGRLLRCGECGLGQRQPCLPSQSLAELYRNMAAEEMDYRFEDNLAWTSARALLASKFLRDSQPSLLDIGCHTGLFLAGLPRAWRRHGIESGNGPRERAEREHGISIIGALLESTGEEWHGRFDAVTMFDVFEHLPDPTDGLRRAAALLKPGGLLIVSTGDMDAWTWRWHGGGHWYLQTPLHLSFASRRFFAASAPALGLRIERARRLAHRRAGLGTRLVEGLESLHWGMQQRGGWYRIPQRLIQSMPGMRRLRWRESVPWSMCLKDHLLVTFVREGRA